ncbi:MAG: hypothetical protein ACRCTP_03650 [Aeromonas popoffii]|uniref:hypothetical protein n=1 Tax=Aeromonas popoffii TaxID=70856 RepID=UPI003F375188
MKSIKELTIVDFRNDWSRLVVSGDSKSPQAIKRLIEHHYKHIRLECYGWIQTKLSPVVGAQAFEIDWMGQLKRDTAYPIEEVSEDGLLIKVSGFWDEAKNFVVI